MKHLFSIVAAFSVLCFAVQADIHRVAGPKIPLLSAHNSDVPANPVFLFISEPQYQNSDGLVISEWRDSVSGSGLTVDGSETTVPPVVHFQNGVRVAWFTNSAVKSQSGYTPDLGGTTPENYYVSVDQLDNPTSVDLTLVNGTGNISLQGMEPYGFYFSCDAEQPPGAYVTYTASQPGRSGLNSITSAWCPFAYALPNVNPIEMVVVGQIVEGRVDGYGGVMTIFGRAGVGVQTYFGTNGVQGGEGMWAEVTSSSTAGLGQVVTQPCVFGVRYEWSSSYNTLTDNSPIEILWDVTVSDYIPTPIWQEATMWKGASAPSSSAVTNDATSNYRYDWSGRALQIGKTYDNLDPSYGPTMTGWIGEAMAYHRALSEAERRQLTLFAMKKYGAIP